MLVDTNTQKVMETLVLSCFVRGLIGFIELLCKGILKVKFSRSSLEVSFTSLMKVVNFYEIANMDVGV